MVLTVFNYVDVNYIYAWIKPSYIFVLATFLAFLHSDKSAINKPYLKPILKIQCIFKV